MALKDASRETRLQWFARAVIDASWSGDVDATDVQTWAKAAGLVNEHTATAADIEAMDRGDGPLVNMENAECMTAGDTWMTFSADLEARNVNWRELVTAE